MPIEYRAGGSWRGSRVPRARRGTAWGNVCDCFFQIYGATHYRQERDDWGNESLAAAGERRLRRPHRHRPPKFREGPRRRASRRPQRTSCAGEGRLRRHRLVAGSKPSVHAIPVLRLPSVRGACAQIRPLPGVSCSRAFSPGRDAKSLSASRSRRTGHDFQVHVTRRARIGEIGADWQCRPPLYA